MPSSRPDTGGQAPAPSGFATLQVQAGYRPGVAQNTAIPPIYQSNAYEFASLADARDVFALTKLGNVYSRNANPTQLVLEERIAKLEGGRAAVAVASGQAATAAAILALASRGHHVVAAKQLYGGTIDLLDDSLADFGIDVTFVDQDDFDGWRAAARPETRLFFAESITNPLAHGARRPPHRRHRARGRRAPRRRQHRRDPLPAASGRLRRRLRRCTPRRSTSAATASRSAASSSTSDRSTSAPTPSAGRSTPSRTRASATSCCGTASARRAWPSSVLHQDEVRARLRSRRSRPGARSSSCRDSRRSTCACSGTARRRSRSRSSSRRTRPSRACTTPDSPSSPWHAAAERYLPRGASAVFSFDLASSGDADLDWARIQQVVDGLEVVKLVANIGDARSLVNHPASMTHSHLTPEQAARGRHLAHHDPPVDRPRGPGRRHRRPGALARRGLHRAPRGGARHATCASPSTSSAVTVSLRSTP